MLFGHHNGRMADDLVAQLVTLLVDGDVYKRQVVDFRNYNFGLDQLIADNDYDQILVLYSFDSFKSDP